ncbi:dirigent protein 1-like [Typha angustifolia]|uniref:dirigent protein 1-like n=1 Tax=Typha angustifolia TaxID=59011 RepID=UPI003C2E9D96
MASISPIANLSSFLFFFLFLFVFFSCSSTYAYSTTIREPNNLPKEKMTHLHFFFHEIMAGPNATGAAVVMPPNEGSPFGGIGIVDDMIREGPETDSKLIGKCQGITFIANMEELEFTTLLNFVLIDGEFAGSSLQVFGKARLGTIIERPVIGGTGEFRMARGYTISKMVATTAPELLILEYDVYVWHY